MTASQMVDKSIILRLLTHPISACSFSPYLSCSQQSSLHLATVATIRMIEVSWTEMLVVSGLGLAMIGRRDLPSAARTAGQSLGRIVGLLQGARARADKFTAHNELTQLQNELRSGLRELDAVKSELAVSMSSRGMVGRNLGSMVPSANRESKIVKNNATGVGFPNSTPRLQIAATTATATTSEASSRFSGATTNSTSDGIDSNSNSTAASQTSMSKGSKSAMDTITAPTNDNERYLAPEKQTIAAVVEEEWATQGISFRSRAEQGSGLRDGAVQQSTSGSAVLANLLQQTLIFDQYDRVVQEQDNILQSKMDSIQEKVQEKTKNKTNKSAGDADKSKK
jgi:Sec-independent protein translocase protein TatA